MSHATFHHNNLEFRFWDSGGDGLPVIFQHGLCGDSNQTREVFPDSARLRLITLECRGHGETAAGNVLGFSIACFTEDVQALTRYLSLQRFVIGGISMGAAIALRSAVMHSERLAGVIIARPAWATEPAPPTMRPNALAGMLLAEFGPTRGLEIFEQSAIAKRLRDEAPDNLTSLCGFFARKPEQVTAELLQRVSSDGPGVTAQDCAAIAVPALIIGHGRDAVHPISMARELTGLLPNSQWREITPKADDKPRYIADFKAALSEYLEGLT